jgi:hypothetical protein
MGIVWVSLKKGPFKLLTEGGLPNLNWKSGLRQVCRFDPLSADFHIQRNKWPNIERTKITFFGFPIKELSQKYWKTTEKIFKQKMGPNT